MKRMTKALIGIGTLAVIGALGEGGRRLYRAGKAVYQGEAQQYKQENEVLREMAKGTFEAEKQALRTQMIDNLKGDPTQDTSALLGRYGVKLKEMADSYGQDDFDVDADTTEFGENLQDQQLAMTLPLAQTRVDGAKSDFAEYVDSTASMTADAINPEMTATEKYGAVKEAYRQIVDAAGSYGVEGIEAPDFANFLEHVSGLFDQRVAARRAAMASAVCSDEALQQMIDVELERDINFAEQSFNLGEVHLEWYRDLVRQSIQNQTERLMEETDTERRNALWQLESGLEDAAGNSAEILRPE